MEYRIVSADDPINMPWLPQDLWQKRVPAAWCERAPRVVDTPQGPYWFCGDARWDAWGGRTGVAGATGGRRMALDATVMYAGLRMLDVLGDDRVMWASDYRHADSTWPESAKAIEDTFKDVAASSRRRILCDDARTLYGL